MRTWQTPRSVQPRHPIGTFEERHHGAEPGTVGVRAGLHLGEHRSLDYYGGGPARTLKLTRSGAEAVIGTGTDDTVKVYREVNGDSLYVLSYNRGQRTAGLTMFQATQTEPYVSKFGAEEGEYLVKHGEVHADGDHQVAQYLAEGDQPGESDDTLLDELDEETMAQRFARWFEA